MVFSVKQFSSLVKTIKFFILLQTEEWNIKAWKENCRITTSFGLEFLFPLCRPLHSSGYITACASMCLFCIPNTIDQINS